MNIINQKYFLTILIIASIIMLACDKTKVESSSDSSSVLQAKFVGIYEDRDSNKVEYYSFDPGNANQEPIRTLNEITSVVQGVSTFDNNNLILHSNLGITVVEVESGRILNTFQGITEIEYNPNDSFLYGIKRKDDKIIFAKANINTGEVVEIREIKNVNYYVQGNSTFDYDSNRYIFLAHPDTVMVVDISDGSVVNKFHGIYEIEYNHNQRNLIGLDLERTTLLSANINNGELKTLGKPGHKFVAQGVSTYAQEENYYIIYTEARKMTVIDVETASIVDSFDRLTEVEYASRYQVNR